jgi:hypothetical protein
MSLALETGVLKAEELGAVGEQPNSSFEATSSSFGAKSFCSQRLCPLCLG